MGCCEYRRFFAVRRVSVVLLMAWMFAAPVSWALEETAEASQATCLAALRQYAQYMNQGDIGAAYEMLAPPVKDLMSEDDFREFVTLQSIRDPLSPEETQLQAKLRSYRLDMILAIETPEIQGHDAIAAIVVVPDPTTSGEAKDITRLRDPEYVKESGLPTWGAQLEALGLTVDDCDLVEDLADLFGDPTSAHWLIERRWLVASLAKDGRWKVWPPMGDGNIVAAAHNVPTHDVKLSCSMHRRGLHGQYPSVLPKPSLTDLTYVKWITLETDPAVCPRCKRYVQDGWDYCPYDGTKLQHYEAPSVKPDDTAGQEPEDEGSR